MGFVDLQVNGYAGVDFNSDSLSDEQMIAVCQKLADHDIDQILATIITAPLDKMIARITRMVDVVESNPQVAKMVAGLHIEGPFLNPAEGYVGAHPVDSVLPATVDHMSRLLEAGRGFVRLVTLAPEVDSNAEVTRMLSDASIVVAGGHSNATLEQLLRGIDNGMQMFTHLGNGCPALLPRHDNIVQRVLSLGDQLMISFIADGHHVPGFALKNYLRQIPDANIIIVSDAINAAGLGPGKFKLSDQTVYVDPDGATWAECRTHYAGCATPLVRMAEWLESDLGIAPERIEQWLSANPARLIR
jgi:N-acetylglucosamine-6-phosphate deacetylase